MSSSSEKGMGIWRNPAPEDAQMSRPQKRDPPWIRTDSKKSGHHTERNDRRPAPRPFLGVSSDQPHTRESDSELMTASPSLAADLLRDDAQCPPPWTLCRSCQHRPARLGQCLCIPRQWIRIRHDAGAHVEPCHALPQQRGPDGDAQLTLVVESCGNRGIPQYGPRATGSSSSHGSGILGAPSDAAPESTPPGHPDG